MEGGGAHLRQVSARPNSLLGFDLSTPLHPSPGHVLQPVVPQLKGRGFASSKRFASRSPRSIGGPDENRLRERPYVESHGGTFGIMLVRRCKRHMTKDVGHIVIVCTKPSFYGNLAGLMARRAGTEPSSSGPEVETVEGQAGTSMLYCVVHPVRQQS